jgi:hypothetical protein
MANWGTCYNWAMDNEDRSRACKIVPDPVSPHLTPGMSEDEKQAEIAKASGAHAISGINSYYYPAEFAKIAAIPAEQRPPLVEAFYKMEFWNRWFNALYSDDVSKRVLDASINMGKSTGVKLLQRAINSSANPSTPRIAEDGTWGPNTLLAANGIESGYLVIEFKRVRLGWYQDIVLKHPEKAKYLGTADNPGAWWKRSVA